MEYKLKVALLHTQNSGVGLWRMIQPAKWINKLGLAEVKTFPFYWKAHGYPNWNTYVKECKDHNKEPSQEEFAKKIQRLPKDPWADPEFKELEKICNWADVIVLMRRDTRQQIAILQAMRDLKKPIILETDDFVHYVPPYNPGARYYVPGSEQSDIWSTKQFEFADAVVVTTPGLKKLYQQLHKKIYIAPNLIDPDYWIDNYPDPKPHPEEIRIGWSGANAHWGDLRILKQVIHPILEKYPQVNFHFLGQLPDWWYDLAKSKRIIKHRFKTLWYYPEYLHSMGIDIGVAPLLDNLFNRGKSNIRWIEYSVNKIATVASPIWAYKKDPMGIIKHNKNVLFAKETNEWVKALSKLIENESLRKRLGNQAYDDVMEKYNLEKQAKIYTDIYHKVYSDYHNKHAS